MSDKTSENIKPNDGSMSENYIRFRVSTDDKEKIRKYFGSFSDMREYILEVISEDNVKRYEAKQ